MQNYMTKFRQIFPIYAASFSDAFAYVEAPGDDGGKH